MFHAHPTRTLLILLAILLAVAAATYVFGMNYVALSRTAAPAASDDSAPRPQDYASAQQGFQYLVSYTADGFVPNALSVKKGETVRFTNNSGGGLWVASAALPGGDVYPGQSDCGASAFDSCTPLKPQEFWEFTFDAAGTWSYKNNSDSTKTGVIKVQ